MSEDPKLSARRGRSKSNEALGCGLYLVATPIGNSRDITLRALDVLASVDKLYAEDTRVTSKLLTMHAIGRSVHSYREHNAAHVSQQILRDLEQGLSVALVSDAGSPLISDPGGPLVEDAITQGFKVYPIPGPSAAIAALTASGLPADRFLFVGFLPSKPNDRRRAIKAFEAISATVILYEAPSRLVECLKDLHTILGDRMAAVARELTKIHEDIVRSPLTALIEHYEAQTEIKGEIVLLVAQPSAEHHSMPQEEIDQRLLAVLKLHPVKEAAAIVAAEQGLARRVVYARALILKKNNED